jgi:peptidoglycan hydrolase-like protein with peptidoglycan-binding domain
MAGIPVPIELVPLGRDEIREVQTKLLSFGFNPGPLDGTAGPMTRNAATRYQQDRGQPQTGMVDRPLLEQLRQDPTPPVAVAQRAAPSGVQRAAYARRGQSSDPFESLRAAGDRLGRWMQSLTR